MYKLLKKEKNTLIYEVTASNQEFETFVNKAYEETKGKYSVQGFRKGKVPRKVIEQNYGKDIFMEDGLLALVNQNYQTILTENKDVQPIGRPEVEVDSVNENGVNKIVKIVLTDDSVSTPEGISIGDGREAVIETYGKDYTENASGTLVYTDGASQLMFGITDGSVSAIHYVEE